MPYGVTDPDYIKAITDFDEGRCIESLKNVLKEQIQKREGILQ